MNQRQAKKILKKCYGFTFTKKGHGIKFGTFVTACRTNRGLSQQFDRFYWGPK